jgi:hypothetical protein
MLRRVLLNSKWQEKIEMRTAAFYEIISRLVELMHDKVNNSDQGQSSKILW